MMRVKLTGIGYQTSALLSRVMLQGRANVTAHLITRMGRVEGKKTKTDAVGAASSAES